MIRLNVARRHELQRFGVKERTIRCSWVCWARRVAASRWEHTHDHSAQPIDKLDIAELGSEKKPIKVTIEADLFRVIMRLETLDNYSVSRTLVAQPQRGGPLSRPRLLYIYKNETAVPVNSDASQHLGAAYLEVSADGQSLEGTYWTARSWTKGLNTAGRIELKRPDQ